MSKTYKIKIPVAILINLSNIDKDNNKANLKIEILNILEQTKMIEIFSEALIKCGFQQEGEVLVLKKENKMIYTVDLKEMNLSIELPENQFKDKEFFIPEELIGKELEKYIQDNQINIDNLEQIKNNNVLFDLVTQGINNLKVQKQKDMFAEMLNAKKLINKVLKEVYKEALKQKAESIGNIISISESDKNGEYKIHLEIQS